MLSTATVIGRLTRDPELRFTASGTPVCNFTLACDRDFSNQAGEKEADFYVCAAWRKTAELVATHMEKGRLLGVTGRFQSRSYETPEGHQRTVWELQVDRAYFLDRKPQSDADPAANMGTEVQDDDAHIPF